MCIHTLVIVRTVTAYWRVWWGRLGLQCHLCSFVLKAYRCPLNSDTLQQLCPASVSPLAAALPSLDVRRKSSHQNASERKEGTRQSRTIKPTGEWRAKWGLPGLSSARFFEFERLLNHLVSTSPQRYTQIIKRLGRDRNNWVGKNFWMGIQWLCLWLTVFSLGEVN